MRLQQLTETFDNLFPKDEAKRKQLAPVIYDMLARAYESIGGLKGSGFSSEQDMIDNIPMWKIFRRGNEIKAVMMYRDKAGRKRVAMATDGSREGKQTLAKMIQDEYNHGRAYAEISGGSLAFHQKILGDQLDKISIPAEQAVKILKLDPSEYEIYSEYDYARAFGNEMIQKRMVGSPHQNIK